MPQKYQYLEINKTKIVEMNGYEYTLVESEGRKGSVHPDPCAFGMNGWALKSCKKIEKEE